MKTRLISIIALLFLVIGFSEVNAQKYTSPVKSVYDRVSSQENASVVYITSGMLKFTVSLLDISGDEEADSLKNLLKCFNEIILLGDMGPAALSDNQIKELESELKKNDYQLMVSMKERGESLSVYMLQDEKTERIKDLVAIINEGSNDRMILSISGSMTTQQLFSIAQMADIDISNFVPM